MTHFGEYLKSARVERGMSIADLSRATKIKESQLERLESGAIDSLPAEVFVVGFIKAYAREVGADGSEALRRYRQARPKQELVPVAPEQLEPSESEPPLHGRRLGVALVVFLILIVATLTLSLLLRHGSAGGGLS